MLLSNPPSLVSFGFAFSPSMSFADIPALDKETLFIGLCCYSCSIPVKQKKFLFPHCTPFKSHPDHAVMLRRP